MRLFLLIPHHPNHFYRGVCVSIFRKFICIAFILQSLIGLGAAEESSNTQEPIAEQKDLLQILMNLDPNLILDGEHILGSVLHTDDTSAALWALNILRKNGADLRRAPGLGYTTVTKALEKGRIQVLKKFLQWDFTNIESLRTIFYRSLRDLKTCRFNESLLITLIAMRREIGLDLSSKEPSTEETPRELVSEELKKNEGSCLVIQDLLDLLTSEQHRCRYQECHKSKQLSDIIETLNSMQRNKQTSPEVQAALFSDFLELSLGFARHDLFVALIDGGAKYSGKSLLEFLATARWMNRFQRFNGLTNAVKILFSTTFLRLAVKLGDPEPFDTLLQNGADYSKDILETCRSDIDELFEKGEISSEIKNSFYSVFLEWAADLADRDLFGSLIQKRAPYSEDLLKKILKNLNQMVSNKEVSTDDRTDMFSELFPLIVQLASENPSFIQTLVEQDFSPYSQDAEGNNLLHHAVREMPNSVRTNMKNLIEIIVSKYPTLRSQRNKQDQTPPLSIERRDITTSAQLEQLLDGLQTQPFTTSFSKKN